MLKSKRVVSAVVLLATIFFSSCTQHTSSPINSAVDSHETIIVDNNVHDIYLSKKGKKASEFIAGLLNEMSLSEKIYQMMFTTPEDVTGVGCVVAAGETTKKALTVYPVGGIVYFSQNFKNREQTIEMIKNTQNYSPIPLFISVDEEGGVVSRLGSNPEMGITKHPPMLEIGKKADFSDAYTVGKTLAAELTDIGFNVDFAPVADVLINTENVEIGSRSFGTDPILVSEMIANIVSGMEENGISSTLKHFPGHGSTYIDSHTGYSESTRTLDELQSNEFLPFKAGIEAGADFIMVSHMTLVNATDEKVPCSISDEVVKGWLKKDLGYTGVIITDSFKMGAITDNYATGEAVVKAINAGVDMILMPQSLNDAHDALYEAVQKGEITEERINESVGKILTLKYVKGMLYK